MGKCVFNRKWSSDAKFSWVKEFKGDKHKTGENYAALFDIVKVLLVLSHGQASVERGFSVNKEIEVENLHEHSLVAQRIICETGENYAALFDIVKVLLVLSHGQASVERGFSVNKEIEVENLHEHSEEQRKRKHVLDEIEELKEKKKRMKLDIDSLVKSTDDLSIKAEAAEETGQLTLVTKSNALRKAAKDNTLQLQEVEDKLNGKLEALKGC